APEPFPYHSLPSFQTRLLRHLPADCRLDRAMSLLWVLLFLLQSSILHLPYDHPLCRLDRALLLGQVLGSPLPSGSGGCLHSLCLFQFHSGNPLVSHPRNLTTAQPFPAEFLRERHHMPPSAG